VIIIKFLALIASVWLCVMIIRYRERIVRFVGKSEMAERYLGAGGTYTMWILIAIIVVIFAVVWLVGTPFDK